MPSADDITVAVSRAQARQPKTATLSLCEALSFVYDTLTEIKSGSPWHWRLVIRQVHGLISAAKRKAGCT